MNGRGQSYEITGVPFFIIGLSAKVGSVLNDSLYLIKDSSFVNNIINAYTFQNIDFKQAFVFVYDDQINYTILTQGTNFANKQDGLNQQNSGNTFVAKKEQGQGKEQVIQQVKDKIFNTNQGSFYVGFGLSEMDFGDFNTYNFTLGVNFTKYVSLEANFERNLAKGVLDSIKESYNFFSLNPILKLPFFNINVFYVKGGLGYSSTNTKVNENNTNIVVEIDGLIYNLGLGYELFLTKNNSIRLEWSQTDFISPEVELRVNGVSIKNDTNTDKINRLNITYKYTF